MFSYGVPPGENKAVFVKRVSTEFTDDEFKKILVSKKINLAKAEGIKSRRDVRSLQMFQLELQDPAETGGLRRQIPLPKMIF